MENFVKTTHPKKNKNKLFDFLKFFNENGEDLDRNPLVSCIKLQKGFHS